MRGGAGLEHLCIRLTPAVGKPNHEIFLVVRVRCVPKPLKVPQLRVAGRVGAERGWMPSMPFTCIVMKDSSNLYTTKNSNIPQYHDAKLFFLLRHSV